jgi:hypothetical protein
VITNKALVLLMDRDAITVVANIVSQKFVYKKKHSSVNALTQHTHLHSSNEDPGEFVATLDLHLQPEEVLTIKNDHPQPKIHATMSVKGGRNTSFQIDTGAMCNVIRSKELHGT